MVRFHITPLSVLTSRAAYRNVAMLPVRWPFVLGFKCRSIPLKPFSCGSPGTGYRRSSWCQIGSALPGLSLPLPLRFQKFMLLLPLGLHRRVCNRHLYPWLRDLLYLRSSMDKSQTHTENSSISIWCQTYTTASQFFDPLHSKASPDPDQHHAILLC